MQSASELKAKGVKRTKVTRPDGTAFVELSNPALAQTIFPPEEGYTIVEVFGYDADLDGDQPAASKRDNMQELLRPLTQEELEELRDRLGRGWNRADEVYPIAYDADGNDLRNPIVYDMERTSIQVMTEYWGRWLGCRWSSCAVCGHESCSFCPACNPGAIAPNGEAYDDAEDTPAECPCA